jgi:hypothetical protein
MSVFNEIKRLVVSLEIENVISIVLEEGCLTILKPHYFKPFIDF